MISTSVMTQERALFIFISMMIFLSVALTLWVDPLFFWFTLFVGANVLQMAFTGFCPAAWLFKKIGLKSVCEQPNL